MDDKKIPVIWKWTVLLVILCNIGLLLTIWLKPHWEHDARRGGPRDFIIHSLNFTDGEVKQYDDLIKEHRRAMDTLEKEGVEYRKQLFENLRNGTHSTLNTDSLVQLIANNQKQIEIVTYSHFAKVRMICNDEQKVIFDKIIDDVVNKMHPMPPPHDDAHRPPPSQRDEENHPPGDR